MNLSDVLTASEMKPFSLDGVNFKMPKKTKLQRRYARAVEEASLHDPALAAMLVSFSFRLFCLSSLSCYRFFALAWLSIEISNLSLFFLKNKPGSSVKPVKEPGQMIEAPVQEPALAAMLVSICFRLFCHSVLLL